METYVGHVKSAQDALILFEACRLGQLPRIRRRLSIKEGAQIKSGSVFAWDESEAGMRRWTDGRTWSPSRVSGSFLTYRELATKRRPRRHHNKASTAPAYIYKADGLIKQSFSICTARNQKLHLISYYSKADVVSGRLKIPSVDRSLGEITIPKGVYPDLNPLGTGGGHSTTVRSIQCPPPLLSLSPVTSDEENSGEPASPLFYYSPRPLLGAFGDLPSIAEPSASVISSSSGSSSSSSSNSLIMLGAARGIIYGPTTSQGISRSTEDKRQLSALERLVQL